MRSSRVNRGRGPLRADLLRCGFTPPASRNHRRPQVADTPTATPGSPAHKPLRTCAQNNGFLDSNNARAITTLLTQKGVLQRPLEIKTKSTTTAQKSRERLRLR